MKASREVWTTWFSAWYAGHWRPDNLPQIVITIRLYDAVVRGDLGRAPELRHAMNGIGVTFEGQQSLRWSPPKDQTPGEDEPAQPETPDGSRYGHLRSVPA